MNGRAKTVLIPITILVIIGISLMLMRPHPGQAYAQSSGGHILMTKTGDVLPNSYVVRDRETGREYIVLEKDGSMAITPRLK